MRTAVPVSARAVETFFPEGYDHLEEEARPRFLLKPPTLNERMKAFADMTAEGFHLPTGDEMTAALRDMVEQLGDPETRAYWLEAMDEAKAVAEDKDAEPSADLAAALVELDRLGREHHPPYARMAGQQQAYNSVFPLMLFRKFCQGWSGYPVPFARAFGQVKEEAVQAMAAEGPQVLRDVIAAGWKINALMSLTKVAAKNSAAPSPSPSDQTSSETVSLSATAGPDGKSPAASSGDIPA